MPELKKPLVYKPITHVTIKHVLGSVPEGEFVAGLPLDGSIISAPAVQAEAWIAAGIAQRVSAAPAAEDDKETE